MRRQWLASGAVVLLMSALAAAQGARPGEGSEKTVLLELFTSQG